MLAPWMIRKTRERREEEEREQLHIDEAPPPRPPLDEAPTDAERGFVEVDLTV